MKGCDTCFEGDTPICVIVRSLGIIEVAYINNDPVRKIQTTLDISSEWFKYREQITLSKQRSQIGDGGASQHVATIESYY